MVSVPWTIKPIGYGFLNRDEPPTAIKFTVLSVKGPDHRYFIEKTE